MYDLGLCEGAGNQSHLNKLTLNPMPYMRPPVEIALSIFQRHSLDV